MGIDACTGAADGVTPRGRGADVVVIGAGAAGLGVAIELKRRGVTPVILDAAETVGASWQQRYEGLHLNTLRWMSALPGERIARSEGRWVAKEVFAAHLQEAAERHRLALRLATTVTRIDRLPGYGYRVSTTRGSMTASCVVVATGDDRLPNMPSWPGRETFTGRLLHAADYISASDFRNHDVLVVGAGNSATEIAVQLVWGGARRVRVARRRPVNILPMAFAGIPITVLARVGEVLPARLVDRLAFMVQRITWGDPAAHGMGRPGWGVATEVRLGRTVVVLDRGFMAAVRAQAVELTAALSSFDGADVVLADGTRLRPDAVIAATGYRPGLDGMVGHLDVLLSNGKPAVVGGRTLPQAPGLYFNGYWLPYSGHLPGMRRTARDIARAIARRQRRSDLSNTRTDSAPGCLPPTRQ